MAGALAAAAGALHREEALLDAHPTVAVAGAAAFRLRSCFGARAGAVFAALGRWNVDLGGLAGEGLFQADRVVIAQVRAAGRAGAGLALRAEELREDVAKGVAHHVFGSAAHPGAAAHAVEALLAEAVVDGALLRIGQRLVGLGEFLEFALGDCAAGITVGVILHRLLSEGRFQRLLVAISGDAEHVIKGALAHDHTPDTLLEDMVHSIPAPRGVRVAVF